MVDGPEEAVAFRLWPPVAIGAPLLIGWLATLLWGDPVDLGGWRVPLGWALVLLFVGWNGWSLWLFGRHETGLLPTHAAARAVSRSDDFVVRVVTRRLGRPSRRSIEVSRTMAV